MVVLLVLPALAALVHAGGQRGLSLTPAAAASTGATPTTDTHVVGVKMVAAGGTKTLFENSEFKVMGACVDNGGGDFDTQSLLKTKKGNANYFITNVGSPVLDFDKADGAVVFSSSSYSATGTVPDFEAYDYYAEVYAESASGSVLIARVATGVHVRGADCTFSGLFQE